MKNQSSLVQVDQTSMIANQLKLYLQDFKKEVLLLIVGKPHASLFDFVVSNQFNDLWNILTTCEDQLMEDQQISYDKDQRNMTHSINLQSNSGIIKRRSRSQEFNKQTSNLKDELQVSSQLKNDLYEIEFALTQQLINQLDGTSQAKYLINAAKQTKNSKEKLSEQTMFDSLSPTQRSCKRNSSNLPQLFSFDSSFVKDLPLSRHPLISNFDTYNNFSLTMGGTLANISGIIKEDDLGFSYLMDQTKNQPTSRFENNNFQTIIEEQFETTERNEMMRYQQTNHTTNNKKNSLIELDRMKYLDDREKKIASKELIVLVKEKQLIQMKDNLQYDKEHFEGLKSQFQEATTEFYQYREHELRNIELMNLEVQELQKQLSQREQYLKKEKQLIQLSLKRKENVPQILNQKSMGSLKGNLKDLIDRMKTNQ